MRKEFLMNDSELRGVNGGNPDGPVSAARPEYESYTVQVGDTVQSIAQAYGTDAETIRWLNSLSAGEEPSVGTTLLIPSKKN